MLNRVLAVALRPASVVLVPVASRSVIGAILKPLDISNDEIRSNDEGIISTVSTASRSLHVMVLTYCFLLFTSWHLLGGCC